MIHDPSVMHTLSSRPWHANHNNLKRDDSLTHAPVDVGIHEQLGKTLLIGHGPFLAQRRIVRHSCKI